MAHVPNRLKHNTLNVSGGTVIIEFKSLGTYFHIGVTFSILWSYVDEYLVWLRLSIHQSLQT